MIAGYITEQSNLIFQLLIQGMLGTADNDIGPDPHSLQFFYAGLGGFRLHLAGRFQIRYQGDVDENRVFVPHLMLKLPDGFQKRLALNITYGSSDFNDSDSGIIRSIVSVEPALDLIRNMRNDLHRAAAVIAPTLLVQHRPVNFPRGDIGVFGETFINESLVMSQIQIRFRAIVGDEDFSVLYGVHSSRININIGIKLLHGDLVAPGFQKPSKRGCCDPLAKPGNNAAGYKNVFYWHIFPP